MNAELALTRPQTGLIDMNTWNLLREQCGVLVKSGFLPKGIDTPEKAMAVGLKANELGIGLMTAFGGMGVVNGRIVIEGHLLLALIQRVPGARFDIVENTPTACRAIISRPGRQEREVSFTIEEARAAGLTEKPGPWKQYTKDMLMWRVVGRASKQMFSDVTAGIPLKDEIESIDVEVVDNHPKKDKGALAQSLLADKAPVTPPQHVEAVSSLADPKKVEDMIAAFKEFGITEEILLAEMMATKRSDLREDDMHHLRLWYDKEKKARVKK